MKISALNVQLNCSLVKKNINVFCPLPSFVWEQINLITVSVHGTLLYFISGDTCGFSALLSSSDYCNQFIIFKLSLNE